MSDDLRMEVAELRALVMAQAEELEKLRRAVRPKSPPSDGQSEQRHADDAKVSRAEERVDPPRMSRRSLARWGGAAAAGGVLSAVALGATADPAAAADGDALKVGEQTNTSSGSGDTTVLYVVGGGTYEHGVLTVTDTAFSSFDEEFTVGAVTGYANEVATALAGVAGFAGADGTAGVYAASTGACGVYALAEADDGVGVSANAAGKGAGLYATSDSGSAVYAVGTNGIGITATTFNEDNPAIIGINFGSGITNETGAVVGDSGIPDLPGVTGLANKATGVNGVAVGGGAGVSGSSDTGPGVVGSDAGSGSGSGLVGELTNPRNGAAAIVGSTVGAGVAGKFTATNAQIQLVPSTLATHPSPGSAGELMVDSTGRLWYCSGTKSGSAKGKWVQLA